jgi:hypothetical protein
VSEFDADTPIWDRRFLDQLPARVANALRNWPCERRCAGRKPAAETVGDLCTFTEAGLVAAIRRLGWASASALQAVLMENGLSLRSPDPGPGAATIAAMEQRRAALAPADAAERWERESARLRAMRCFAFLRESGFLTPRERINIANRIFGWAAKEAPPGEALELVRGLSTEERPS